MIIAISNSAIVYRYYFGWIVPVFFSFPLLQLKVVELVCFLILQQDPTRALRMTTRRTLLEVWRYLCPSIFLAINSSQKEKRKKSTYWKKWEVLVSVSFSSLFSLLKLLSIRSITIFIAPISSWIPCVSIFRLQQQWGCSSEFLISRHQTSINLLLSLFSYLS